MKAKHATLVLLSLLAIPPMINLSGAEFPGLLKQPGSDIPDLVERFDADGDGVLNKYERTAARQFLRNEATDAILNSFQEKDENGDGKLSEAEIGGGWRNPLRGADTNGDGFVDTSEAATAAFRENVSTRHPDAEKLAPQNLRNSGSGLYDMSSFRTFFLEFEDDDWLGEMHDFYHTEIDVPADLIVDGDAIASVGVRYRGNSSFFLMEPDKKRSLNLSIDHAKKGENLYGYKTLNLHNGAEDPTFVREVLYLRICRDYIPAFKANWVKLVVNGESWGVYLNVQQYNNDFVNEWFGSKKGVRWKASAGGGGTKGLSYEGDDPAAYAGYELKNDDDPEQAIADLIHFCKVLSTTTDDELEEKLRPLFDIDGALWSLALENLFVDEGYVIRKSDYDIFQDKDGRFHLLQHDANEVFNQPHGPGLPRGFDATKLDPLHNIEDRQYAVIHRLLKIPQLRARYLAHMRTIMEEWFNWERLEPHIQAYRAMIAGEVRKDVRKLYSNEDFEGGVYETVAGGGVIGIKQFVDRRREFLLNHELFSRQGPVIASVTMREKPAGGGPIHVTATIGGGSGADWVGLYWASKRNEPYELIRMHDDGEHGDDAANDGVFGAEIPAQKSGSRFHYYVEARTGEGEVLASSFHPRRAEAAALTMIAR